MKYWFRPARFWGWFAAYYPVSVAGWAITFVLVYAALALFVRIDSTSYSVSDTLIRFAPWAVAIGLLYDLLCFRTGEYPSWWKHRSKCS